MLTLTYDPARFGMLEAWQRIMEDWRKLYHTLNTRRYRTSGNTLRYVWCMEEMPNGYPHIHVFFPKLRFLIAQDYVNLPRVKEGARPKILRDLWTYGRSQVWYMKGMNVAKYIAKYVYKLEGWSELAQAIMWYHRRRIYGYSLSYSLQYIAKRCGGFVKVVSGWRYRSSHSIANTAELLLNLGAAQVLYNNKLLDHAGVLNEMRLNGDLATS
jgi:hypothetical protein